MTPKCSCGALTPNDHVYECRFRKKPTTSAVWEHDSRVINADPVVIGDDDIEFHVLIRCVHELNKLNAVDKAAASRVTDYLFNRYTGK